MSAKSECKIYQEDEEMVRLNSGVHFNTYLNECVNVPVVVVIWHFHVK